MIIDLILERKETGYYEPERFYRDVMNYESLFNMNRKISYAMDYLENDDVIKALCDYIDDNGYNPDIKNYIKAQNWLE